MHKFCKDSMMATSRLFPRTSARKLQVTRELICIKSRDIPVALFQGDLSLVLHYHFSWTHWLLKMWSLDLGVRISWILHIWSLYLYLVA